MSGTVSLSTNLGTLSANTLELINGEGSVTLKADRNGTATVTASMSGVSNSTGVNVGIASSGEPANIQFSINPTSVTVRGVGGDELSNIDVTVVDEGGNLITESNLTTFKLELTIVEGPNGGEGLVGSTLGILTVPTQGGRGAAAFRSGIRPGSASIKATATYTKGAVSGSVSATAPFV